MYKTMFCLLCILQIINFVIIYRLHHMRQTKLLRYLRNTVLCMIGIIALGMLSLLAKSRQTSYCVFSFFYIAFSWYILTIYRFSVAYSKRKPLKLLKSPLFWITIAESAALIWGIFFESFFTITHAKWLERTFWVSRSFSTFYIYVVINSVVLVGAMITLTIAANRSARIYRLKYLSIVIIIAAMTAIALLSHFNQQPIFLPIACCAFCEMIIVYMALYYAPKKLNQRAMRFVADRLNDGIVLYDDEHQLQLVTAGYRKAFGPDGLQGIEEEETYWRKLIDGANMENAWNGQVKSVVHEDGIYCYEIQHMSLNEDGKLIGTVYWIRNVTEAIDNYRNMVRRANFDELTGLYNEAHFHERARQMLEDNPDTTFVMICSSVEKFRLFKALFGKEKYDDYLIRTAESLKTGLADFPNCRYGRIGESDFYIMMPKELFHPQQLLDAIDGVAKLYCTNNYNLKVKAGVYEIEDPSLNMLTICNNASMACDIIKGDYGKKILWFDKQLQKESMRKERYNAELSSAIENGEIQIYLQPQIDNNGKLIGAEALARWIHKEDGFISPAQFIPHFEKNGRITELDTCIWHQACQKLSEWKEKGRDDLYISVNISPKDLYALDIYEYYVNLIKEYEISSNNLKLEITESAIINDLKQHISLVERLQKVGFEVEMDDFGSAYSSFNMLKDICVDVLKIDMKFLGETENQARSHAILRSIIGLSKGLQMKTVAEGVETEEQLSFLKSVGCDIYQGFYFAKPMSIADFEMKYL